MSWVRIHDGAMLNMKIAKLSDSAFRLWVRGLSYCQTALTDGLIPREALQQMGAKRKDVDMLARSLVEGKAPLWETIDAFGYKVHDYLIWNDSREIIESRQRLASHRRAFMDDPTLKQQLRDRDRDQCRYCGRVVNWSDRKGIAGATYDHVEPKGPATLDNLVVACRSCNSRKRDRTPAAAGMRLLPEPGLDRITDISSSESRLIPVTKPNQTCITTDPPVVPLAGGRRIRRADRQRASDIVAKRFGVAGCPHEPRCDRSATCVEHTARDISLKTRAS